MTERYFLTGEARQELSDIADAVARDGGPARAERVMEVIRRTLRFLSENPRVGHAREDLTDDPSVRFWAVYSYLVAFVPSEKSVGPLVIVRIIHGSRDPDEIQRRFRKRKKD